ncbi:prolyl oligopeptidase family serine peptidase [Caulobacter sp. SLTY]|uniref:dienelactone hydrolase family protein n=1 Tax=Caulobacter sp. SLTY TaxID=2683262 RepID=UPI001412D864|nr:dienelactone hydrolase family protein [Caulobacter sp. SLTY]NBB14549.1 prolyl oligopeptidase family serine peptidase [Caulobacter sp. SLTY]
MRIIVPALAALLALSAPVGAGAPAVAQEAAVAAPDRVTFRSMDDAKTELVAYLFKPVNPAPKAPAVVLMHGRAGAYSSLADGTFNAETLTMRHKYWARYWASRGYYALVIDGFGPRGYPGGFAAGTYNDRPDSIDEVTIRPLDAYAGLRFLRSLPGVDGDRIGLMGWSNGGSATLAAMADDKPGDMKKLGFRAGISFYPGCGLKNRFKAKGWKSYAPVLVLMGTADEEVSPKSCDAFVKRSQGLGGQVEMITYEGAAHSFDDPGKKKQSVPANAAATADARKRAADFFEVQLAPR